MTNTQKMSAIPSSSHTKLDYGSFYESILRSSGKSIIIVDQNGEIIEWGEKSEELTGYKEEYILGDKIWNILHMVTPQIFQEESASLSFQQRIEGSLKGNNTIDKEPIDFVIKNIAGEYIYIRSELIPIEYEGEQYICILSENIEKKKIDEQNTIEKTKLFDYLFYNKGIGICILDSQGRITKANKKFMDITGYSIREYPFLYYENLIHISDIEKEKYSLEKSIKNKKTSYSLNKRIITRDGEVLWVKSIHELSWNKEGKLEQITVFLINIHKQKKAQRALVESQKRYNYIIENTSDIICQINKDRCISFINPSFEKITGYQTIDIIGKDVIDFIIPEDYLNASTSFNRVLKNMRPEVTEVRIFNNYKETTFIEFSLTPISENGKIIGVLAIGRDITARKKIHEDLHNFNTELKENIETKDKIFSLIAHDLKNPFNILHGFSNLLSENINEFSNEEIGNIAKEIQSATEDGIHLLKNLLEWSLTQTGKLEPKLSHIRVSEKIDELILILNKLASIKIIRISSEIPESLCIYADEQMFVSVLRNLISNAIKFTHHGGRIKITSICDKDKAYISVEDTGIGMSKETQDRLFDTNVAISTSGTIQEKGTGLGLILCKEFINSWQGEIFVESEIDKGSKFTFSVPLCPE